jgi:hypothetical protein
MAIWQRKGQLDGLVHHSDRGVQYLAIRYTERLAEAGAVTSVGSRGDSYDNALAETIIGLYKTELIRRRGPWRGIDDIEYATLEWGRLVQPSSADGAHRPRPTGRVRGRLPPEGGPQLQSGTHNPEPSVNPGRFSSDLTCGRERSGQTSARLTTTCMPWMHPRDRATAIHAPRPSPASAGTSGPG